LRRRKIAGALVPALLSALITEVVLTMMFLFVIMGGKGAITGAV
jgi:hypothetical protein